MTIHFSRSPVSHRWLWPLLATAAIGLLPLQAQAAQPPVESRVKPLIAIDDLQFRDLNGNGQLDPYEDWRLPVESRVDDLVQRMNLAEKAGLMLIDTANAACNGAVSGEAIDYLYRQNMRFFVFRNAVAGTPNCIEGDGFRRSSTLTPTQAARFTNAAQTIAESSRLGIPVLFKSNPRNHLDGATRVGISEAAGSFSAFPREPGLAAAVLGSDGDTRLIHDFGQAVAREWHAIGVRGMYGYQADLGTEPRWNRYPQLFSEDAGLTADIITALVQSIQGGAGYSPSGIELTIKHFPGGGPQEQGLDPHYSFGKNQVYPAGKFGFHIEPFKAAIDAGAGAIMPYYGVPIDVTYQGVRYEQVGMAFSSQIVTDLLRGQLGFRGYVNSDTSIIADRAWGLEAKTIAERLATAINSGNDILSGFNRAQDITDLVASGAVTESRIGESARRLLKPLFLMGLFEKPYVDESAADAVLADPAHEQLAADIQRRSIVLLQNEGALLPLSPTRRVLSVNGPATALRDLGYQVVEGGPDAAADADVAVIRVQVDTSGTNAYKSDDPAMGMDPTHLNPRTGKPWGAEDRCVTTGQGPCTDDTLMFGGAFPWESDNISFTTMAASQSWKITPSLNEIKSVMNRVGADKVVLAIEFRQPYVLDTESGLPQAGALLATFGVSDAALADVLTGKVDAVGKMPFALARTMDAVIANDPDAPGYAAQDTLFPYNWGLSLDPTANR
ncbi:glycoside hydrolase family 3 N-terminal domain-containing protein [Croceibacterium xixiisoli]|nr:glycoside hydrolase family 3 N-terminal domain-containing protein [Croceibacterium xixiisoli]